jgi:hypothetical protein
MRVRSCGLNKKRGCARRSVVTGGMGDRKAYASSIFGLQGQPAETSAVYTLSQRRYSRRG